jgi:hypothetical protein
MAAQHYRQLLLPPRERNQVDAPVLTQRRVRDTEVTDCSV